MKDSLRFYGVLRFAPFGGFDELRCWPSDEAAIRVFLAASRSSCELGAWNADLWFVGCGADPSGSRRSISGECYPLVVLRVDPELIPVERLTRREARSRCLFVRDGSLWRVANVDVEQLGRTQFG